MNISTTNSKSRLVSGFAGAATIAIALIALPAIAQLGPDTTDPTAVAREVYRAGVPSSRSGRARLTISAPGAEARQRTMRVHAKSDASARKSLLLVEDPGDVRGTGFVSVEFPGTQQDPQRWLYMPNLKRTSRVAGGQMSGAFLGSDLAFADLSQLDPELFTFTMLKQSDDVDGETCWVIEATPKTPKTRDEIGYATIDAWVSKKMLAAVRSRATLLTAGAMKYFQGSDFRQVGSAWTPFKMVVRTVQDGKVRSETVVETLESKVDPTVTDDDFSKSRLEQGL
jgi:hypothetical protein